MAKLINLEAPASGVINGMELSFYAPCDCSNVTGITLEGKTYQLVDASGTSLSGCSKYFTKGATLSVIIDTVNAKATLLNPRVNTYTKTLGTPDDTASASANTVWARVKDLANNVTTLKTTQVTGNDGSTKGAWRSVDVLTKIVELPLGMHTYYANSDCSNLPDGKTCRFLIHVTDKASNGTIAWVLAFEYTGKVYSNYAVSSSSGQTWKGWKEFHFKTDFDRQMQDYLITTKGIDLGEVNRGDVFVMTYGVSNGSTILHYETTTILITGAGTMHSAVINGSKYFSIEVSSTSNGTLYLCDTLLGVVVGNITIKKI